MIDAPSNLVLRPPAEARCPARSSGGFPVVLGFELTVFDPDLDPDGHQAELVADILERSLR